MNKQIIGTIVGSALLSVIKSKLGSRYMDHNDYLKSVIGNPLSISAKIKYKPYLADLTGNMIYTTDTRYEVFLDWYTNLNDFLDKLNTLFETDMRDLDDYRDDWGDLDTGLICDAFDLPNVFDDAWIFDIEDIGRYIIPTRCEIVSADPPPEHLGENDICIMAGRLWEDSGDMDEDDDYDFVPVQFVKAVIDSFTDEFSEVEIVFFYDRIDEKVANASLQALSENIKKALQAFESSYNEQMDEKYRASQIVQELEVYPSDFKSSVDLPVLDTFNNNTASRIRRF